MDIDMRKTLAVAIVSAVGLSATLALADDKTPSDDTLAVQAESKHEAAARHQAMAPKVSGWAATTPAQSKELREAALKARAADATMTPEEKAMYKKGKNAQRQMDLQEMEKPAWPAPTAAESKELREAALKARAAYATMTPEEKAMYKKGKNAQRQIDLQEMEKNP
jgi:23S rRNA maturation mini-RNase III